MSESVAQKILLIEDDETLSDVLKEFLQNEGFNITVAADGADGLQKSLSKEYSLAVLDLGLPKIEGLEVLRRIRAASAMPVIIATGKNDDVEKIVGLELGADDYVGKPYNLRELAARIRAILRRTSQVETEDLQILKVGDIEAEASSRNVSVGGEKLELTTVEFDILIELLRQAGKIVSREFLSEEVLQRKLTPFDRSIDMHISNLRRKLGKNAEGEPRIKTIRGSGYIFALTKRA